MAWDFEIEIYRGDTPTIEFSFVDATTDAPLNLSGWTLYFAAKDLQDNVRINKQMNVLTPQDGVATVTLTSDETNYVGRLIAEVEARSGIQVVTLCQGLLIIRGDVRP